MSTPNAKHSSKSQEWFTPTDIIEVVRTVLGGIDLDPASCEEANQIVKATWFYTRESNGLKMSWGPRVKFFEAPSPSVWLNPPGGTTGKGNGNYSLPGLFWDKLMEERPYIRGCIFLCFSIEQLQTTQGRKASACDFPVCIPSKRLKFGLPGGAKPNSPTHANALVYVPGREDASGKFAAEFSRFGKIMWPSSGLVKP